MRLGGKEASYKLQGGKGQLGDKTDVFDRFRP